MFQLSLRNWPVHVGDTLYRHELDKSFRPTGTRLLNQHELADRNPFCLSVEYMMSSTEFLADIISILTLND